MTCMTFPFLDDVEPIADAVAAKAEADSAAAAGLGARAAYHAAAAREHVGAADFTDVPLSKLSARNAENVLRQARMQL